ncbi:MAG: glycosylasparaginase [Acidobacteria bacterium ACB1]|nr:N(4)-(Beta-N-acetylglucosaminyl)-L-asparaginase [Pyrinomonadaceae bacterium]MCE7962359.1 glycosylasparaginase [Acidobacteria bacterium ACB1]RIJ96279.1 MAG: glycosylasparaginase [Acidobacteriota bacterium]
MDRRRFLEIPVVGLPLLTASRAFGTARSNKAKMPVVVSTWDSGRTSNAAAWPILAKAGSSIDAVEAGGRASEDEPSCCVGLAAWPDRDGKVTLDSSIMKGNGDCGAVSFLERIKHPVSVARKVMENTPHVLLSGIGAQEFAVSQGFPLESGELSPDAEKEWKKWLEKSKYQPIINIENRKGTSQFIAPPYIFDDGTFNHDTMGTIAMDAKGHLAGMVTTSGMAFKIRGRAGDSPIIGAGLFVDDEVGAATSSGVGEEVIRTCGTHTVVEQMRLGRSPEAACREAVRRVVKRDPKKAKEMQVGFVALSKTGAIGAFAIQKGFSYTITSSKYVGGKVFQSKSWF